MKNFVTKSYFFVPPSSDSSQIQEQSMAKSETLIVFKPLGNHVK